MKKWIRRFLGTDELTIIRGNISIIDVGITCVINDIKELKDETIALKQEAGIIDENDSLVMHTYGDPHLGD
jgi:hypothetical protein